MAEEEGVTGVVVDGTAPDPQPPAPDRVTHLSELLAATLGRIGNRTKALPDAKWAVSPVGVEPGLAAEEAAAAIAAHVTDAYTDRAVLLRIVESVTALHRPSMIPAVRGPNTGKRYCVHCHTHAFDDGAVFPQWPCPTVLAVAVGLGLVTLTPPEKAA